MKKCCKETRLVTVSHVWRCSTLWLRQQWVVITYAKRSGHWVTGRLQICWNRLRNIVSIVRDVSRPSSTNRH